MDHSAIHEAHLSGAVLHPLGPLLLPPFLLPLKRMWDEVLVGVLIQISLISIPVLVSVLIVVVLHVLMTTRSFSWWHNTFFCSGWI